MILKIELPNIGLSRSHVQQSINVIDQILNCGGNPPPIPAYIALQNTRFILLATLEALES